MSELLTHEILPWIVEIINHYVKEILISIFFALQTFMFNRKLKSLSIHTTKITDDLSQMQSGAVKVKVDTEIILQQIGDVGNQTQKLIADLHQFREDTEQARHHQQSQKYDKISQIWNDVKDDLEGIISKMDGRKARPFAKIDRRNFRDLIQELYKRSYISDQSKQIAEKMYSIYFGFRNKRKAVEPIHVEELTKLSADYFQNTGNSTL